MNALNRLRWKCRRGMLELDIVLNQFLELDFANLEPAEQKNFEQLLEEGDEALWSMISEPAPIIPPCYAFLLERLRACST